MEKESILTATDYVSLQKENKLLMNYNQDLIKQLKKQKEINQKAIEYINENMEQRLYTGEQYLKTYDCCTDLLQILEDKEV